MADYKKIRIVDSSGNSLDEVNVKDEIARNVLAGKTDTSVLPNDNGEIKTKFRAAVRGYTGEGNPVWYYKLAQLPESNNFASLIISGRLGGWTNRAMSYFQGMVWNRGGTGISCQTIAAGAINEADIFSFADIVVYKEDDTSAETVYVKCSAYFIFDLDLELFQFNASILFDGTYTTSPTGTLVAQASTSTNRLSLVNEKLLVAGQDNTLTDSGWQSYTNASKFTGTINYRKVGTMLMVSSTSVKLNEQLNASSYMVLGQLPSGYRPSVEMSAICMFNTFSSNTLADLQIAADGTIYLFTNTNPISANTALRFSGFGFI